MLNSPLKTFAGHHGTVLAMKIHEDKDILLTGYHFLAFFLLMSSGQEIVPSLDGDWRQENSINTCLWKLMVMRLFVYKLSGPVDSLELSIDNNMIVW